ncbi:MAG: ORC1-type DNA replication protein [Desulfurococcales archaeon]|nr:ORC1-type DNA replication protein [Desulfurococcales archaeon]
MVSKIFANREVLMPDYIPKELPHRESEIRRVASVLAPALRGERPSNLFIYGLTGTGKTAVIKRVMIKLVEAVSRNSSRVKPIYVNVKQRDTPYRVMVDLAESIGLRVPFTGLSTGEVYSRFTKKLSKMQGVYIIVLDEIDFLVKKHGDDLLYKLTRINEVIENAKVSLVGITNSVSFVEELDPRVKSSLGEEEIVFPPYNAEQLKDILETRAAKAFKPGVLDEDVIPLCAALAAREHGDARRALDLLRVSGEMADRLGDDRVTRRHVLMAREEIERDRVGEVVRTLPLHSKLVLASVTALTMGGRTYATTGEVNSYYRELVKKLGLESITLRRLSGILGELDMLGLISARVISKGRYGKTRIIELSSDPEAVIKALGDDIELAPVIGEIARNALGKRGSMR